MRSADAQEGHASHAELSDDCGSIRITDCHGMPFDRVNLYSSQAQGSHRWAWGGGHRVFCCKIIISAAEVAYPGGREMLFLTDEHHTTGYLV